MIEKKRVIIFGATGKTGRYVWRKALEEGYETTVFVRTPAKVESSDPNLKIANGDVFSPDTVVDAVAGHDAVIICLGSINLKDKTTLSAGTENVLDGMRRHGVRRLVVLSAAGVGGSWAQISWGSRILFKTLLKNLFADHHAQEELVEDSGLDWTIVRAAILKDAPASGNHQVGNSMKSGSINRGDVADFLVRQIEDEGYIRQAVTITA